jgi:pyridinium-3,5-bisthiocarboxylic acid mononucleotide nickel chelatase
VYFDCASGASGDMLLGALVDLGLPLADLERALRTLPLEGYGLKCERVRRAGIGATRIEVVVEGHGHGHGHAPGHGRGHADAGHVHRGLREILPLIEESGLAPLVKERSRELFRRLAEVEGRVHGIAPDEVHFHEVGAVDSIVDIVGCVYGLHWLGAERFVSSPLNLGSGTVRIAHGTVSVPAPATAELVKGVPVFAAGEGELLTPTGALLVTAFATAYGPLPAMRIERTGWGAGASDPHARPNVLRLIAGEAEASASETVVVLETEIDDMSPQLCPPLGERLLAAGALDVYFTSILMKKGRPGLLVTVLAPCEGSAALEEVLFSESTTLGVRRQVWERTTLARDLLAVTTPYGAIRIKIGRRGGRVYNAQPEFEDCATTARERGVPVKEVWSAALAAYRERQDVRS